MGNSLMCCLACVLPCGALDFIRVVHLNGHVQEFSQPLTAGEILRANPGHVLTKPSSQGVVRRVSILSPETQLRRGGIYFLIPAASDHQTINVKTSSRVIKISSSRHEVFPDCNEDIIALKKKKKKPRHRDRRSSHACEEGAGRPHLESITED